MSFSQNLIFNGTFEDKNICTEYKVACSPHAWRLTSVNLPEYKNEKIGFIVFNSSIPNIRSYIQSPLADTLIIGEKYFIKFDIFPGNFTINEIGVFLSEKLINTKSDILLKFKPDIEFLNNKKIIRKKKIHLEKEFIATKESKYIVIGNFYPENILIKKGNKRNYKQYKNYYYFIDNIKLISINNKHDTRDIEKVKKYIYSQTKRHPVPPTLFENVLPKRKTVTYPIKNILIKTDTIILSEDFFFEFDSYNSTKSMNLKIDSIFFNLKKPIDSIIVIGHTDSIGNDEYNNKLSLKRVKSVARLIMNTEIISPKKISYFGKGSNYPIATNLTKEGRDKNRRVEIIISYLNN